MAINIRKINLLMSGKAAPQVPSLRRAMLYVPCDPPKMLLNSSTFKADTLIYDLEDSIQTDQKTGRVALKNLTTFLGGRMQKQPPTPSAVKEIAVRIPSSSAPQNYLVPFTSFDKWLPQRRTNLSFVIPKVTSAFDVELVVRAVHKVFPQNWHQVSLILLIENAKAVMNIREITSVTQDTGLVNGLIFGAEDFAADVGLTRTESLEEMAYARSAVVTAARAADIPSVIDLVTLEHTGSNNDMEKLQREALNGKNMGFTGKQVIHPNQVIPVQAAFSPAVEQVTWATQVLDGWAEAKDQGRGSFTLQGKMMDRPMVARAHRILEKAVLCGMTVPKLSSLATAQMEDRERRRAEKKKMRNRKKEEEGESTVGDGGSSVSKEPHTEVTSNASESHTRSDEKTASPEPSHPESTGCEAKSATTQTKEELPTKPDEPTTQAKTSSPEGTGIDVQEAASKAEGEVVAEPNISETPGREKKIKQPTKITEETPDSSKAPGRDCLEVEAEPQLEGRTAGDESSNQKPT